MDYIISECEQNDLLYAYYKKEFWFWDENQSKWIVSDFAKNQFEKALKASPELTPQDFMTNADVFWELDEWEISTEQINALELAEVESKAARSDEGISAGDVLMLPLKSAAQSQQSCENAAKTQQTEESAEKRISVAESAPLENGQNTFDYSGLDEQTVDVMHMAETEIQQARQGYIIRVSAAVAAVHEELVGNSDKRSNQYSDATFTAWCTYVGIKRDAAYRFLQVDNLLNNATAQEAAQLELASPSLLYAAAKSGAPQELVQAVKSGDITTHKQYQEAMARIKELEHENEMERKEQEHANAAAMKYKAEAARRAEDQQRLEGLLKNADERLAAEKHKSEGLHNLLANRNEQLQKAQSENSMLLDRQGEHIARIKELENRPIEVAVQQPDPEDIERRAAIKAEAMTADMRREHEDRMNDQYDAAILALRTIENNRMIAKVSCCALPHEMRAELTSKYRDIINKMQEDMQCL